MLSSPYKRVGLVAKPVESVIPHLKAASEWLKKNRIEVLAEPTAAGYLGKTADCERPDLAGRCDLILLFGGDGTFLSVAASAVRHGIPIAGVNLGSMGFLTEIKKESLLDDLSFILFSGHPTLSLRSVLRISGCVPESIALNDLVVNKGNISRIIRLNLRIDTLPVAEIEGDGLIVATPTGSTAYSLSAGGPILTPQVKGLVITPICPHALTFRPLVVPDQAIIDITLLSEIQDVFLTLDGQQVFTMHPGDCCRIQSDPRPLQIISGQNLSYFTILREKLNWGSK
jgi:NAD+ kinase